jgi:hypothetical protein
LLLCGVVIAGYVFYFTANEWTWQGLMAAGTATAGVLLFAAGAIGLVSLFRHQDDLAAKLLRLCDGVVALLFGGILVAMAFGPAVDGPIAFGLWAVVAGLLLVLHAVPSRLRDTGPAWAWIWTGIPLALTGIFTLIYTSNTGYLSGALWLNALAMAAAAMCCTLGFGLAYPYVLALPWQESSAETMFAYDDITWRRTPPELEQHDLDEVIEPPKGDQAA